MKTKTSNWTNSSSSALEEFDFTFEDLMEHCNLNNVKSLVPACSNGVVDMEAATA